MRSTLGFVLCIIIICSYQIAVADQIAITENGQKVILKDDGTWEYVNEQKGQLNSNDLKASDSKERNGAVSEDETTSIGEKDPFTYRRIDSWIGEDFVFLPTGKDYKLLNGGQDYDIRDMDTWYITLPYKQYIGRIAKVISIDTKELLSGYDWIVEFEMKDNKEKLVVKAQGQIISGIARISDIDNARNRWLNKAILVRGRWPGAFPFGIELRTHNKNPDEPAIFHIMRYTPLTVIDVIASPSSDTPVRFILKTINGKEGYLDVNVSGTNTTKMGMQFTRFFFVENLREKYDWPDSMWNSIQLGKINIGMSTEQVLLSWGEPIKKNITISENTKHEQWIYETEQYLYFANGILTNIQYSK